MDDKYNLGTYSYASKVNSLKYSYLPEQLKMDSISGLGVLLQLLMGKVVIYGENGTMLVNQKYNYTRLPYERCVYHSYKQFNEILGIDVRDEDNRTWCNKCLLRERTNSFIYEHILNELTQYFAINGKSPCEGFVHLYRTLELISYSFPLIYASKSKSYQGTYDSLKKLFQGDSKMGELKFFRNFLKELFEDEAVTYNYEFEILFDIDHFEYFRDDLNKALNIQSYFFEGNTLTVKFGNVIDIFIGVRNKYFHMLLGQGNNNFLDMRYEKNEMFKSMNPVFLNWISCIFIKVIQYKLSLYE